MSCWRRGRLGGSTTPTTASRRAATKDQVDADSLREAADRDSRSQVQRNHDALAALLRAAADGGLMGASHRGLPPHIVNSITETELRHRAGVARTATGTDLPITDVLRLAAKAQMHLAVFDEHIGEPLFLGRAHLAPACGPHNRAVGPRPGQWETVKLTTGPDRGRYDWRRNRATGDSPDELRVNHIHHLGELLDR